MLRFIRFAFFRGARHLVAGCGEMLVAASAASAFAKDQAFICFGQVADEFARVCIVDNRAGRDDHDQIVSRFS